MNISLTDPKRIVYNTGIIYARVFTRLLLGLFTTRLVLNALGEVDYGIYILVGGVIGMLEFINTSMTISSMRFIANNVGSGNEEMVNKAFNSSIIIHFFLGIIVVLILEIVGFMFFENILNIPKSRVGDAKLIFHIMVISTFLTFITVPFGATFNALENFLLPAITNIIDSVYKLGIAIYIAYIISNKLVTYGLLILLGQLLQRIFMQLYIHYKYKIFKFNPKKYVDKRLIKDMLFFAGWSMFGSLSYVFTVQLRSVIINMFFGVRLNAASGITSTLTGQLGVVSDSLTQAIQPQIMKSEGGGNREKMLKLTQVSAKFSVFLLTMFSIIVFIETPYLLKLWLKEVPEFTVIFCRLMIINMIIEKYTFPITTALTSVGNIKTITFVTMVLSALGVPVILLLFRQGMPPQTIYIVSIGVSIAKTVVRLYIGHRIAGINVRRYLNYVFFRGTLPLFFALMFAPIPFLTMDEGFLRLFFTVVVSMSSSLILIKYFGLTKEENQNIKIIFNAGLIKLKSIF